MPCAASRARTFQCPSPVNGLAVSTADPRHHPNVGDRTPHGQADLRVARGLAMWMAAHRVDVPSLTTSRPLLL